jgi:hypothetical protein
MPEYRGRVQRTDTSGCGFVSVNVSYAAPKASLAAAYGMTSPRVKALDGDVVAAVAAVDAAAVAVA